jgi:uncharacterized integral membrane protein
MNKNLAIVAGALALIGLIVNVAVDRDNVYDMTLSALWVLTLILAFAGAFVGGKKSPPPTSVSSSPSTTQQK